MKVSEKEKKKIAITENSGEKKKRSRKSAETH